MASQVPKHDFAPSWLKIPDHESLKPGGSKSSEDRVRGPRGRDDYYYRQHPNFIGSGPLSRQRSFDNGYDDRRGYLPQGGKLRHHSVDDEHATYNGYGYGCYPADKCGAPYKSQPSLYRDKHQNGRFPANGAYSPGQHEGYMYDYYPGGDINHGPRNRRQDQRPPRENGHREEGKELQEEEFPSLNGGDSSESKKAPSNGVWDGRPKITAPTKNSNSVYKVLVPNKGAVGAGSKKAAKAADSTPTKLISKSENGKEGSPTPPMEILNTVVTQPKTIGDKKSNFLKALRRNNGDISRHKDQDTAPTNGHAVEEVINNGVEKLDIEDDSMKILSSSLEAEQRLLREMGWTEEEEECVLTEDEKRAIEQLKLLRKDASNGFCHKRPLKTTWSPQHNSIFHLPSNASQESDSDSDLDL